MPEQDDALATEHLRADLGGRSARGGVITMGAQGLKIALQILTVAVLARLLPPADFGLIAMVSSLNAVVDLVKEMGLSAATIRKPDLTHAEVTALFWINAAAGAVACLVLMASAPLVAMFYGQPPLVAVMRWLAIGFLLSGLVVQHWALLRRQMRFGVVAIVDVGSEAAGFVVALVLALRGAGYWSLVAQRLTAQALSLVASWTLCHWRPGWPRRVEGLGDLLGYGASVTGVNVTAGVTRGLDQMVVGYLWGAAPLGLYERAVKLLQTPAVAVMGPLYAVSMPLMSRLEGEATRYRSAFDRILALLAVVMMPGAALVAAAAPWVVAVMFGHGWDGASPLVAWFAAAAAYLPLAQLAGLLYLTQNRKKDMLRASLVDAALCVVAIAAGIPFGPLGVAASLAICGWGLRLPAAIFLATRRGPVPASDIVAALAPAAFAALVVLVAVGALRIVALPAGIDPKLGLALAIPTAMLATIAALAALPHGRRTLGALLRLPVMLRGGGLALGPS